MALTKLNKGRASTLKRLDFEKTVAYLKTKNLDYTERSIPFRNGIFRDAMIELFYISQLTDRAALTDSIVKPLVLHCSSARKPINAQIAMDGIIYADNCKIESDAGKIEDFILSGMVVILFSNDKQYIVVNLKKVEHRSVPTPQLSYTIRGPQDCFAENLDANLSLIRYRVKDKNMRIKHFEVGRRTKARVAVIYIEDIANDMVVNEVQKRIERIDVDGIGESGELQAFLLNNKLQLFPQIGLIERSAMAFHSLLEGKVLVLMDGSGVALLAPKTFSEFFYSCDDKYDNKFFGLFARLLRYTAIIIALTASSLFVALTSFHTDVLPVKYAISLSEMRSNVPVTALIGALSLEFIVELLREALLRVPKQIGSAIGIVGAIVIGSAAIAAGIFSPLLLIIVSTSLLASFAIPDYSLVNPFRVLKFVLLLFTGTMGFFGFTICLTFILAELVSLNSFGVPYMAPWAPFNLYDFIRAFISNSTTNPKRPNYLRTKDKTRSKQ
jgi:spore germination protein KA/spore germination protein